MFDIRQTSTKILLLLVVLVIVFVPGRFALAKYQEMQAQADTLRSEADTLNASAAEAEAVAADPELYQSQLDALGTAIPAAEDLPGLVDQLSAAADESGVRFSSGSPAPAGNPGQYQISMTVEGGADQVSAFLEAVRALPRLVTVNQISIAPDASSLQAVFYSQ